MLVKSYLAHANATEGISRASATVDPSNEVHSNLCLNPINNIGSDAQKRRYLPKQI